MSIFQFVWQILLVCGLGVAAMFGLFSAPWYVLGLFLLVALLLTWKLMPSPEAWVTPEAGVSAAGSPHAIAHQTGNNSTQADKRYRGAQYPTAAASITSPPVPEASPQSAVLSYRGAAYAPKSVAEQSVPASAPTPELKYRGAKCTPPSPRPS